jgi:hypothetical protein
LRVPRSAGVPRPLAVEASVSSIKHSSPHRVHSVHHVHPVLRLSANPRRYTDNLFPDSDARYAANRVRQNSHSIRSDSKYRAGG